jgi:hypothetical protein
MTVIFLFSIAVISMVFGLLCKSQRWGLLISVYEPAQKGNLLGALSIGHILNVLLPFRVGDVVRIVLSGKKLKNGYPLSIATVIVDLYVDLVCVGGFLWLMIFTGNDKASFFYIASLYFLLIVFIASITFFCIIFRTKLKKIIQRVASVFNQKIEFDILYVTFLTIGSFKDIAKNIDISKFITLTIKMWIGYGLSYAAIAAVLQRQGINLQTADVFEIIFGGSTFSNDDLSSIPLFMSYLLLPLSISWIYSKMDRKLYLKEDGKLALPQLNKTDRAAFLKTYYSDQDRLNLKSYLEINKEVTIVSQNFSGSNATTVTILKDHQMFYRKYAFDSDAKKLTEQITWIEKHKETIHLPPITNTKKINNYVFYDMPLLPNCISLFKYIHTVPVEKSWEILVAVLSDLKNNLHTQDCRICDFSMIDLYIENKVNLNLNFIREKSKYICDLEKYDSLSVNGKETPTLKNYTEILSQDNLRKVFEKDHYSEIHGDLTVENIVCIREPEVESKQAAIQVFKSLKYYLIDPNGGNIHDSPNLDYSKLLQSLHGNYELLTMVESIDIEKNSVQFFSPSADNYQKLYSKYRNYLNENFTSEQLLSIYYHEAIHWLRLLPYRINKDEKMAVIFYVGLLEILRDLKRMSNER